MIKEIYELVNERLALARQAPAGACKACSIEELEEVLQIIREICEYHDEQLDEELGGEA